MTVKFIPDSVKCTIASTRHALMAIKDDIRGLSGIEFAMIAPMLVGVYLGVAETALAVTNSRKVSRVAGVLADLVSQTENISGNEVDGIINASVSVMAPYSSSGLAIKVIGVTIDGDGIASVDWSRSNTGASPLSPGSSYPIPADIRLPNSYLIVTNVTYSYSPSLGANLISSYEMDETSYNVPRTSATVNYTN